MKEDNRKWKAADPIACAEGILEMKCDPNTCDNADDDENAERHPPSGADPLAPKPTNERDNRQATRYEKQDDAENAHARRAA